MKLLRNLGTRLINKTIISYGEFLCPISNCGKIVERPLGNGLIAKSCGCHKNEFIKKANTKHGDSFTRLYRIWAGIKTRCLNIKNKDYPNYGGRGITICNEWLEFTPFRDWSLSNGYSERLQINRIENDGNYEPSNCNFMANAKNCQNKRNNVITQDLVNEIRDLCKTEDYTLKELSKKYNINKVTLFDIINNKTWKN